MALAMWRMVLFGWLLLAGAAAFAAYQPSAHRALRPGGIAVTEPVPCEQPGKTSVLTRDISSPMSTLFLANNVTLDLNGYTCSYAG